MKPGDIAKLVKLRKNRVDQAIRDLQELQTSKRAAEARLEAARQRFESLLQNYRQIELGLQSDTGRSMAEFAAVNGDINAMRALLFSCKGDIAGVEDEIGQLEKRITETRARWRMLDRAHQRGTELSEQLKTRGLMAVLAAEEFLDS